jgi:hypothetical protein
MNWNEFKTKYKSEITVGLIVFVAIMAYRIMSDILKNK